MAAAMDDAVLVPLREIVSEGGPEICRNAQRVEALLRDLAGGHRREIAVLVGAVREGVPAELLTYRDVSLPPMMGEQFARKLRDNLGLADEPARWAVDAWATVLGVTMPEPAGLTSDLRQATSSAARPEYVDAQQRIARLVSEATRTIAAIPEDSSKALALGMVATVVAETDTDHADLLLDRAVLLAKSITNENMQTRVWHDLSITIAGTYPERAETLARSVQGIMKDDALGCLANLLASTDSDRALRLARLISHQGLRMHTLDRLVTAISATEPDRAERLARSLASEYWKAEALCHLAAALTAGAPVRAAALLDEAEHLTESLPDEAAKACALSSIANMLASTDQGRAAGLFDEAEQLARSCTDELAQVCALGSLAIALAEWDPDRALEMARSLADRWYVVGEIAKTLVASDPDRALQLARSITIETPQLADIAVALATADADGALDFAWSIGKESWKISAVVGIAQTLIASDLDRAVRLLDDAERFVRQMAHDLDKVTALVEVVFGLGLDMTFTIPAPAA